MNRTEWVIVIVVVVVLIVLVLALMGKRSNKEEFLSATDTYKPGNNGTASNVTTNSAQANNLHAGAGLPTNLAPGQPQQSATGSAQEQSGIEASLLAQAAGAPITKIGLPASTRQAITAQVAEGKKINAIKSLRQATGMSLVDAKNAIDSWYNLQFEDVPAGNSSYVKEHSSAGTAGTIDQATMNAIREQLDQGNLISAIKILRMNSDLGLKEAKEAVESMIDRGNF